MPHKKKSIIVLAPRPPYPVIGGDRLRIYKICEELCKYYSVTLLTQTENKYFIKERHSESKIFDEIKIVYHPRWRSILQSILAFASGRPAQVGYFSCSKLKKIYEELKKSHDATLCHLVRAADPVNTGSHPLFLEMTDAISLNYFRVSEQRKNFFLKVLYKFEASKLYKYEQEMIRLFDKTFLVSAVDRDFIAQKKCNKIIIASNGVEANLLDFRRERQVKDKCVIAFIGNMRSIQNRDACEYFAGRVLPILLETRRVEFRVIGQIDNKTAIRLKKYAGTTVTGTVESIAEAAADVNLAVCSVRMAAGVQNKLLEYMALGIPAVSSAMGLEGLGVLPGKHILHADTPEQFVEQIEWIIKNPQAAASMAKNARDFVVKHHSWSAQLRPMVDAIRSTLKSDALETERDAEK